MVGRELPGWYHCLRSVKARLRGLHPVRRWRALQRNALHHNIEPEAPHILHDHDGRSDTSVELRGRHVEVCEGRILTLETPALTRHNIPIIVPYSLRASPYDRFVRRCGVWL